MKTSDPQRQRQPQLFAITAACIAVIAGSAAILFRLNASLAIDSPSATFTVLAAMITLSVATAAGVLVLLNRQQRRVSGLQRVEWDTTTALAGRLVEQQAQVLGDVGQYLNRRATLDDVVMVGHAETLLSLLDDLHAEFFAKGSHIRVVLFEDDGLLPRKRKQFLDSNRSLRGLGVDVRHHEGPASSALIMTDHEAFYGLLQVPGLDMRGIRALHQPWVLISRAGPLWFEWRDAVERLWALSRTIDF